MPIVVLSDGTWCGRETGTKSNIYELARIFGIDVKDPNSKDEYYRCSHGDPIKARYRHGVGLNSTFLDYLFNGVTALDIAAECVGAYKFIVDHYTGDDEIWLFGLSRGAFTVRCVAGMINNCGIIRRRSSQKETHLLCEEVYRIYRSRYEINKPHMPESVEFRRRNSWPLIGDEEDGEPRRRAPVRFMGILDTVGSLGIPTFSGGVGLDWPEFYDHVVSSVVEQVCHLTSLHDRFYIFQPCLVKRADGSRTGLHEEWLPGVHYDLGRQRFRFFRTGAGKLENFFANWGIASKVIEPNVVLSDLALLKMLKCIQKHDPAGTVVPTTQMKEEIEALQRALEGPRPVTGDGDVYAKIVEYGPFGSLLLKPLTGGLGLAPAIWELFFALRDRLIPSDHAKVYRFQEPDALVSATQSVASIGRVTAERYPSKTLQSWEVRRGGPNL